MLVTERSFSGVTLTNELRSSVEAGPRRRRRKDARPGELIEASLQEFALHGFAGARLEDVAARAGVVKGTIYRYFADKESLFLAAVQSRITPVFDEILAAVDVFPGTTRELLQFILEAVHRQIVNSDLRVLMRIVVGEGERFPALTELYYREIISKGRTLLQRIVARGLARGEVRDGPVSKLPEVIIAPALMAAIWRMNFNRHAPISGETFLDAHLDLVCNGLLRSEATGNE